MPDCSRFPASLSTLHNLVYLKDLLSILHTTVQRVLVARHMHLEQQNMKSTTVSQEKRGNSSTRRSSQHSPPYVLP